MSFESCDKCGPNVPAAYLFEHVLSGLALSLCMHHSNGYGELLQGNGWYPHNLAEYAPEVTADVAT